MDQIDRLQGQDDYRFDHARAFEAARDMSGFSLPLSRRQRCGASGKEYTRYLIREAPDAHGKMKCPVCGKGVTLRAKEETGQPVVIPRHLELIIGL